MGRGERKIYLRNSEEIELIRESSLLVGKTHGELSQWIKPGMTTKRINDLADQFIQDNGGVPSFKGYGSYPYPFPWSVCASINEVVVHGFPTDTPLQDGDILSLDIGIEKSGFHGDSAFTYRLGEVSEEVDKLLRVTMECLDKGVEKAVAGNRVGDIAYAVQKHAEDNGYGVVRELVGHGLGQNLHEAPEVPNFGKRGKGPMLKEGMVLAIEPMINMGKRQVVTLRDGWTVRTKDGKPSAHYEHNVAVKRDKPDVLSTFNYIEENKKQELKEVVA